MLTLFRLLMAGALAAAIVALSVANRGPVEVSFWPLQASATVPLFALALFCVGVGAVAAGAVGWFASLGPRRRARRDRRRLVAIEAHERRQLEEADLADLRRYRERRAAAQAQHLTLTNPGH